MSIENIAGIIIVSLFSLGMICFYLGKYLKEKYK